MAHFLDVLSGLQMDSIPIRTLDKDYLGRVVVLRNNALFFSGGLKIIKTGSEVYKLPSSIPVYDYNKNSFNPVGHWYITRHSADIVHYMVDLAA